MTKAEVVNRADRILVPLARRWSIPFLRIGLAVTFIWFGSLKILDVSPVADLVASTVYFVDSTWFVPALGAVEVLVGLGLLFRVWLRAVLALVLVQMVGTFLVFIIRPELAFQDGNPLLLTTEGEFIVKNIVLLGAVMAVGSQVDRPEEVIETND